MCGAFVGIGSAAGGDDSSLDAEAALDEAAFDDVAEDDVEDAAVEEADGAAEAGFWSELFVWQRATETIKRSKTARAGVQTRGIATPRGAKIIIRSGPGKRHGRPYTLCGPRFLCCWHLVMIAERRRVRRSSGSS
jgi:radical SAM superfamily enzyme YgiQ (UPF0313 family)